jgi:hypothetical protein
MNTIKSFGEFDINEGLDAKTGAEVWRLMIRDNPQLGTYHVFGKVKVTRVSGKSVSCDDNNVYDKETGRRKNKGTSVYGSSDYQIMNHEDAVKKNAELEKAGEKVRGLKED